ncbi:MAG: bifunctional 1-(5-phosphoribosyl)-5-((5-phosphoribosylamino)methylideneamino)imidazole-4-carboxamide isomerase/phosphoribosylanthranilate isomerase PriA [Candidatus Ancillula sp.]|jgi:phosphoribosylformimino-5-aminoimidazole carboxamide ribotide isomerase/phosphoribosylanthranilate isomerase|nr:bifunctional 1-(5-phosphoribosyl)-5-((5-phosphoribosylamino)methylideneamino)imidazole-4-carboxamide isomerase/phosphoribosylanthranilate isomerase PriA [Candidatus Ancillula sp.]
MLTLFPAIDITDGKAVRLVQGELEAQTNYGTPLDVAKDFVEIYSKYRSQNGNSRELWVHLVDLDAAFRRGDNRNIISQVVELLHSNKINVELSGGIKDDKSLDFAIKMGAARVNVGTAALENPEWTARAVGKYADKLAVGLDVRGETLAARGWTQDGGNLWEVGKRLKSDGVSRFVVTDVNKDGTLQGPNLELLNKVANQTGVHVTASGGIASLTDISAISELKEQTKGVVDAAIFGKSLYSGAFTLEEALALK